MIPYREVTIDLNPQLLPPEPLLTASQYDNGRPVKVKVQYNGEDFDLTGMTAQISVRKPSGKVVIANAQEVTGSNVIFNLITQMTAEYGMIPTEISLTGQNQDPIGTANWITYVEKSPSSGSPSDTWVQDLDEKVEQATEAAEAAEVSEINAEAWAVGERGGVPVTELDPTYRNNAKYWAEYAETAVEDVTDLVERAETAAGAAADSATESEGYASDSAASATASAGSAMESAGYATQSSQYATNSANSATASATSASASAQSAGQSAASATESAGYATSSENYAGIAAGASEAAGQSATAAAGSASTAAGHATNAANSATASAGSAAQSAQSATASAGSATAAAGSATAAATSATEADASADRAQEILDSIPEDYSELSDDVADLKSALNNNIDYYLPVIDGWIQNICINSGTEESSNYYDATDYISIIPALSKLTIVAGDTSWFSRAYNAWYDKNKNYISSFSYGKNTSTTLTPPESAAYFRISRGKEAGYTTPLSISTDYDGKTVCDWIVEFYQNNAVLQSVTNGLESAYSAENRAENRLAFDAAGTYKPNVKLDINVGNGIVSITDNNFGSSVHLELKNPVTPISAPSAATKFLTLLANHVYRLRTIPITGTFTGLDSSIYCAISSGGQSADYIVPASGANKTFSYGADTTVSLYVYVKYETTATVSFQYILEDTTPFYQDTGNYIIGADLRKRVVNVSQRLGVLTGSQAFCIYNGNYYSFDLSTSTIYVQDANFGAVSNHAISIGHGNALQRGSGKYAYASGWDDNKVYKIDLDTVTVVDTITLPTTSGTTTCVVDDVNGIVYIFHRTTSPYTEEPYTFIAYDYINQTELYRRKTPAFAAMQGCDLVNGTIITTSGLGTAGYPDLTNYYRLYNTSGDVIGEYKFPAFATREPEGVYVDRETFDVFFDIETSVYRVASVDT